MAERLPSRYSQASRGMPVIWVSASVMTTPLSGSDRSTGLGAVPAARLVAISTRSTGQGVTVLDGQGVGGPVQLLFTIVRRRDIEKVLAAVNRVAPNAFVSIEDIRQAHQGSYFAPQEGEGFWRRLLARKAR